MRRARKARSIALTTALVLALAPAPALAGKDGHGKPEKSSHDAGGKGQKKGGSGARSSDASVRVEVDLGSVFGSRERDAARGYFVERYGRGHCPPGLAKKNNGCLPPGQAKKRYRVGERLPDGIVIGPLPHELEIRIGLPPSGHRYGIIDGDLVKLAIGSMLVVDAVEGLVE